MKIYKLVAVLLLCCATHWAQAQELFAKVTVNSSRVGNNVDKKTFQTLESALNIFINNRKWGPDNFSTNERIQCNFLLNLESTGEENVYKASLTVQSARPIFNSTYTSPIINWQDNDVIFKYIAYQQLEFNENRITGTDPLVSNLTAVIAYWINMILGMDYDSFSPKGGNVFFQKAQNIVNGAPDGKNINGWKAFDGTRNRYWLVENLLNSRYNMIHDAYYNYYRKGMDQLYENENKGRSEILNVLSLLNDFNNDNSNTMILAFFLQGKTQEFIQIFSKANNSDKQKAMELLSKIDITSSSKYKEMMK
jgi:hypothetical protein